MPGKRRKPGDGAADGPGNSEPKRRRGKPGQSREPRQRDWKGFHKSEMAALVSHYFLDGGLKVSPVLRRLKDEHGVTALRQDVYTLLRYSGKKGWLRFEAPHEFALREKIRHAYPWLQQIDVVRTASQEDVPYRAAEMIVDLLRGRYAGRDVVHIGFAGGHTMRGVARRFAACLCEAGKNGKHGEDGKDGKAVAPPTDLPKRIVFHVMVAGFHVLEPHVDPITFCTFFDTGECRVQVDYVVLHAPPLVYTERFEEQKRLPGTEDAYRDADKLDIVVTSAAPWSDPHSILRNYMARVPGSVEKLEQAECIGDVLWRPLGPNGPVEDAAIRAMTLVELSDLTRLVRAGKHVVLVLGKCRQCNVSRTGILRTILNQREPLISHLILDSRHAAELVAPDVPPAHGTHGPPGANGANGANGASGPNGASARKGGYR